MVLLEKLRDKQRQRNYTFMVYVILIISNIGKRVNDFVVGSFKELIYCLLTQADGSR